MMVSRNLIKEWFVYESLDMSCTYEDINEDVEVARSSIQDGGESKNNYDCF